MVTLEFLRSIFYTKDDAIELSKINSKTYVALADCAGRYNSLSIAVSKNKTWNDIIVFLLSSNFIMNAIVIIALIYKR